MKRNKRNNPPTKGRCNYCDRLSVRLLDPPLIEVPFDLIHQPPPDELENLQPGDYIAWTSGFAPNSPFEVIEVHDDAAICLTLEMRQNIRCCWRCFVDCTQPPLHLRTINIPLEIRFNLDHPWEDPRWLSQGREPSRHYATHQDTDTPIRQAKQRISQILTKVTQDDDRYYLNDYIRWGQIEEDLHKVIETLERELQCDHSA